MYPRAQKAVYGFRQLGFTRVEAVKSFWDRNPGKSMKNAMFVHFYEFAIQQKMKSIYKQNIIYIKLLWPFMFMSVLNDYLTFWA